MTNNIIDSIQLSGTIYTLSAQTSGGGVPESTFSAYTAATDSRIAEDEEVTAAGLNALNDRLSEDEEVTAAGLNALNESLSGKQDTLVSSVNIKTINNESILGSGNIDIQGGGSSYTAGDGIDITNNVISVTGKVDTSTYETYTAATDTAIAGKQDILTGGDGIDINNDVISVTGKADTSAVTAIQDSLSGYVTTDTEQIISGRKIFTYSAGSSKAIEFKQTDDTSKVGFRVRTSAASNNELASFEFRPNTFTVNGVQHPLLYFGHYRNTNTAAAGIQQTYIGFRQYDQPNAAAYHYLIPLPEKAKRPFSLTTSFKDYYAPMGYKVNTSGTIVTTDETGVVDLSSYIGGGGSTYTAGDGIDITSDVISVTGKVDTDDFNTYSGSVESRLAEDEEVTAARLNALNDKFGGLKLVKLTQSEYNALSPNYDSNTLYVING